MTGIAISAKSEALELHELSSVSGGSNKENQQKAQENRKQMEALNTFRKALEGLI